MRLPLPMLAVIFSISSSDSSCLRYAIDGSSHPGWAPSASRQCLHFALHASVMKNTRYTGSSPFLKNIFLPCCR